MSKPAARPAQSCAAAPAQLVAAANAALADMAADLRPLLHQELSRLAAARAAWREDGSPGGLRLAAHDLRGLGALYGAPLTGRIAASLERLLVAGGAPAALAEAHMDAILAVVREGAADGDPRGEALAAALEAATRVACACAAQAA